MSIDNEIHYKNIKESKIFIMKTLTKISEDFKISKSTKRINPDIVAKAIVDELYKDKYRLTFNTNKPIVQLSTKVWEINILIEDNVFKDITDGATMFFRMSCKRNNNTVHFSDNPPYSQGEIVNYSINTGFDYYFAVNGNHVQIAGFQSEPYEGNYQQEACEITIDI